MTEQLSLENTIGLADLAKGSRVYKVIATVNECNMVAQRLDISSVNSLISTVEITDKGADKGVYLKGEIQIHYAQNCAVSLENFERELTLDLMLRLVSGETLERLDEAEAYLSPDEEEYDALEGDTIPLGEIIIQTLSMDIDPHEKFVELDSLTASLTGIEINAGPEKTDNPFAKLEILKKNS